MEIGSGLEPPGHGARLNLDRTVADADIEDAGDADTGCREALTWHGIATAVAMAQSHPAGFDHLGCYSAGPGISNRARGKSCCSCGAARARRAFASSSPR